MRILNAFFLLCVSASLSAQTLTPAITYQGELEFAGAPAQGAFDFEFLLFDAASDGNLVAWVPMDDVLVQAGLFSVELDFGPGVFIGEDRWLQLGVRAGDSMEETYTPLLPRQRLTPAPFALHAQRVAVNAVGSAEIIDGSIAAADLGSGVVGTAAINASEVQRRVVGACPAGTAMVSVAENGQVTCAFLTNGDVTGIVTQPDSGLVGGCEAGDCELAVDSTVLNGPDPVGSSSSWTVYGAGEAWRSLQSVTITSGSQPGAVVLFGTGHAFCQSSCPAGVLIGCQLGWVREGQAEPANSSTSGAFISQAGGMLNGSSMTNIEEMAMPADTTETFTLVGRGTGGGCQFMDVNAAGIFQPN
ncbi:hypothetical protein [Wenzhouxiangella marina]|uniref:Uncharacterized protein n=1 Tax=Wenzhouxiangella marina TaxID=1579979 RepID=A0A0K0XTU8_9GAMM|nr:hypothetical protein [Wenzhouxiangella marina]AKS41085.1 hypothetical protein WM2015_704 [Wenzhouxiangella marina]MBB6087964.1 hypothetical protein [Wenzhouxiangella marina]